MNTIFTPVTKSLIFLSLCFMSFVSSAQKPKYTLLWKITGNGSNGPSYLFGTMHVKDKRVFNFSDSVMLSIQNCNRFALEVHPDTLISKLFASFQNQDSSKRADKLLNKEQFDKLSKKFEEKHGYKMDKTNGMMLESLMEPDNDKPDDAVSFIDAYLYGIARTLNKEVYGLEDASSQLDNYYGSGEAIKERLLDLLDDDTEAARDESKEEMVRIYSTGDLDAIYKYAVEGGVLDSVITERNKVMAASMIKFMHNETLFTAVGAAHLPGPDGVIALLRKAGYRVEPVGADFTGVAAKYHIDYMKMKWPEYRNAGMGYAVDFPGIPVIYPLNNLNIITYPDLANDVYYGSYVVFNGTVDKPANRAAVIAKIIANLHKNKKNVITGRKDFQYHNLLWTELTLKSSTGYTRDRFIMVDNRLYCLYVGAKRNQLNEPYISRFFDSFKNLPLEQKTGEPWINYADTLGAFTIKFPDQPKSIVKELPVKMLGKEVIFKLNMLVSTDTINSAAYLVRYNDYPSGTYLKEKDLLFNSLINEFKNKGKITAGPVKITMNGLEGREVKLILNGGYNTTMRLLVRGNRIYILFREMLQADLKEENSNDPFFESFRLNPYKTPQYFSYQPDSGNFKIKLVAKPTIIIDSAKKYSSYLNNIVTCYATNPNSGGVYGFEYSTISPYYRVSSADSLYKLVTTRFTGYRDSLLNVDSVTVSGVKGREIITVNKQTKAKTRTRLVINNDRLFCITGYLDNSELFNETSDSVYNSLTFLKPTAKNTNLSTSKAALICKDLLSTDTLVSQKALGALAYYRFTSEELPCVYRSLEKSYPDDTLKKGTRTALIGRLKFDGNDSSAVVLAALYPKVKYKNNLKSAILDAIPVLDKKNGHDTYLKFLTTDPPVTIRKPYEALSPLLDSTEFAAANFEKILPFIKYDNYRSYLLRISNSIASLKNPVYDKMLRNNYAIIMSGADADFKKYIAAKNADSISYDNSIYTYLQLMNTVKNEAINDRLTRYYLEKDANGTYATSAIVTRIGNHLPCNKILVDRYLDSINSRYDIMEAYNKIGQLGKVPVKYRNPAEFAKLCLYQEISIDDYGSPTKMSLLGNISKNGEIYYVFKYHLPERDENATFVGISGPYRAGASKLNFNKYYAYSDYDILKANWRLQAINLIKPLKDTYK